MTFICLNLKTCTSNTFKRPNRTDVKKYDIYEIPSSHFLSLSDFLFFFTFLTWCQSSNNPIVFFDRHYFSEMGQETDALRLVFRRQKEETNMVMRSND